MLGVRVWLIGIYIYILIFYINKMYSFGYSCAFCCCCCDQFQGNFILMYLYIIHFSFICCEHATLSHTTNQSALSHMKRWGASDLHLIFAIQRTNTFQPQEKRNALSQPTTDVVWCVKHVYRNFNNERYIIDH